MASENKILLPCIPSHHPINFPGIETPILLTFNKKFMEFLEKYPGILIINTIDPEAGYNAKNLLDFGVMGTVSGTEKEGGDLKLKVKLESRMKILEFKFQKFGKLNYLFAECAVIPEKAPSADEFKSEDFQLKIYSILANASVLLADKNLVNKVFSSRLNEETVGKMIDALAYEINFLPVPHNPVYLCDIARESSVVKRADRLNMLFWGLIVGLAVGRSESQDEERTAKDDGKNPADIFREQYNRDKANFPEEVKKIIEEEIEKLSRMQPFFHEYATVSNYLEWLLKFPWGKYTQDNADIEQIINILNEDHYGLAKPKNRIVEYIASRTFNPRKKAPILCFIGPPGTGKTSLGRSIARAMNRKFVRISVGGVEDESKIRGHSRSYVGALTGEIAKAISRSGSMNPVFMIDEIDKLGRSVKGDPASALLEVLDPEQNYDFKDHYMDVGTDLSQVLFIMTANLEDPIPEPLRDRMEIIYFTSYTENEKIHIAEKFIIPKKIKEAGLDPESSALAEKGFEKIRIEIKKDALSEIINEYIAEAGVRELERKIDDILRKVVKKILERKTSRQPEDERVKIENDDPAIWEINEKNLDRYLDKNDKKSRKNTLKTNLPPGVAPMLAVSDAGGSVLYVEAVYRKNVSHRKIKITGVDPLNKSVGKMIEESADIAWNFLFKEGGILSREGIPENIYLHIHFADGSTPKDGPSAGVAILWALYSLFTNQPVKSGLVPTGEVTLALGEIGPIGAVKEKILGAIRATAKEVLLPKDDMADVQEITEDIEGKIKIIPCETMIESLKVAFPDCPKLQVPHLLASEGLKNPD